MIAASDWMQPLEPRVLLSDSPFVYTEFTPLTGTPTIVAGPGGLGDEPMVDFNGDGRGDFIVSYRASQNSFTPNAAMVSALLGAETGPMVEVTIAQHASPATLVQVLVEDLTGDGRPEVIVQWVANGATSVRTIDVYLAHDNGTFTLSDHIDLGINNPTPVMTVFDMTGDGQADLFLREGAKVSVFPGNGDGSLDDRIITHFGVSLVNGISFTEDLDGDSIADVVISGPGPLLNPIFSVFKGLATGGYSAAPIFTNTDDGLTFTALRHLNGDDALDIVAYAGSLFSLPGESATVFVLRNNGNGTFTQTFNSVELTDGFYSNATSGTPLMPLETPDLDGDGDHDLILIEGSGLSNQVRYHILTNNGNAGFTASDVIDVEGYTSLSRITVADVDDDGALDIVSSLAPPTTGFNLQVLFNDGDNTFDTDVANLQPPTVTATPGQLIDVDNDGQLDFIFTAATGSPIVQVLVNNGDRTFSPVSGVTGSQGFSLVPTPMDFNGDSLPDVVAYFPNAGQSQAQGFQIYLGVGDGSFVASAAEAMFGSSVLVTAIPVVGDFNGDGRPDMAFVSSGGSGNTLGGVYVATNNAPEPTDTAGHDPATARDLGVIAGDVSLLEHISPQVGANARDREDWFQFEIETTTTLRITATPQTGNLHLRVYRENGINSLGSAFTQALEPAVLNVTFEPGIYFVAPLHAGSAGTTYRLDMQTIADGAEIGVLYGLDVLESGQVNAIDFGAVPLNATDTANVTTFRVRNEGDAALNLAAVTLPAGFAFGVDPLVASLAPGASDTFSVKLITTTPGEFAGDIVISSDGGAAAFRIPVVGVVDGEIIPPTAPEIMVLLGAAAINDGQTTGANFGTVVIGSAAVQRTFTVRNDGDDTLTLGAVQLPAGFTLVEGLSTSLAPNASDTFTVSMATATLGVFAGDISFATNDANENPFNFGVTGTIEEAPPVMSDLAVTGAGVAIAAGDVSPTALDGTDFGNVAQGETVAHEFLVTNTSDAKLKVTGITLPAGFSLAKKAPKKLNPGKAAKLVIRYDATTPGLTGGPVVLTVDDAAQPPFSFAIAGEAVDVDDVQDAGAVTKKAKTQSLLGAGDNQDKVRFNIAAASKMTLSLKAKKADVNLILRDEAGDILAQSTNAGKKAEKLKLDLEAGAYTLEIVSIDDTFTTATTTIAAKLLK